MIAGGSHIRQFSASILHWYHENFDNCARKSKTSLLKLFKEKTILVNFGNLSAMLCPILSKKILFYFQLNPHPLEFTFSANFSILETSFSVKIDIQSNWVLTNTWNWHISKNTSFHFSFKYTFGTRTCLSLAGLYLLKVFKFFYQKLIIFVFPMHFQRSKR